MTVKADSAPLHSHAQDYRTGLLWAFGGTAVWSSTALFIEVLNRDFGMTTVELAFWRTSIITLVLGVVVRKRYPGSALLISRREMGVFFLAGLVGIAIFALLFNGSVQENGGAVATTLIFCSPVFVALGGALWLNEKVTLAQVIAIVVILLGCGLVAGITDPTALIKSPLGAIMGLGSGLVFAIYILIGKVVARTERRGGLINLFYYFLSATLVLTPLGLIQEGFRLFTPALNWNGWFLLITLSLISLCGYAFFNASLKYLPAAISSLIQTLEPSMTGVLSLIFLGRTMSGLQWGGTLLIISGVVGLQLRDLRSRKLG
ncbi:MAG: EamA family transporter [Chloroflexi bacterium]|uniref:DMT family transporter n=1 Tax=Candidatus Chlorohelix allophototropha TaxID=3003348 RepID=A0A8T7M9L9_9CHLR|nr:EamA family transporter [Chloroflexota bacterium]WJW68662.1 DMT family transporter [Chloroflexota bacterium L227-S17]